MSSTTCARIVALLSCALLLPGRVAANNLESGTVDGTVLGPAGTPVAGAQIRVTSPGEVYNATTDNGGRFEIPNVSPDTYVISVTAAKFDPVSIADITVTSTAHVQQVLHLLPRLPLQIAAVRAHLTSGVRFADTSDSYDVRGEAARGLLTGTPSGLGAYSAGSVLGAVSNLPGIQQDQFSDVVARGSKVFDSAFLYDGTPFPQELISSPGGTTFGSPLTTTGVAYTTVTQSGFTSGGDNAFGAVVNEVPISGSYPGHSVLSIGTNLTHTNSKLLDFQDTGATPDQRVRWALAATSKNDQLPIGDGKQFYTGVAGGMGLDYTTQATYSAMGNLHFRVGRNDDVQLLGLFGGSHFDQYGQPYPGLTFANTNGLSTTYPGENPYAPVTQPGKDTGNYSLQKLQYTHNGANSTTAVRFSRGQNSGASRIVVGSDLTFPLGFNSYDGNMYYDAYTASFDVRTSAGSRQEIGYGTEVRSVYNELCQVIPLLDDVTTSNVRSNTYTSWLYDRYRLTRHLSALGTLRLIGAHEMRADGNNYNIDQLDPHAGLVYQNGAWALTANYDHISQLPLPTAVQRIDSGVQVPFVPLGVERGNHYTFALEHTGATSFRLTYWAKLENNRTDILPEGSAIQGSSTSVGASPSAIGLPVNLSDYRAHGLDLQLAHGPFSLVATYATAQTLDPSGYNLNQINPALTASHTLIPQGFFPNLTSQLSYAWRRGNTTVTPSVSFESGYPYGNGTKVWVLDANGNAVHVNNDNHVNAGYAYYFLQNPALPYNATTNPYIANLGTPEGDTPYTLHTPPRTFVSLQIDQHVNSRWKASLTVNNLLNFTKPVQYISNPYMPGPPGYTGGNAQIATWMGQQWGTGLAQYRGLPYILGNGIPTLDGYHPEFGPQFNYGTGPYVSAALPYGRTALFTLTYSL